MNTFMNNPASVQSSDENIFFHKYLCPREYARGRLGGIVALGAKNFALYRTRGEKGVTLIFFIYNFHSVTIYYHCILFLLPINGNSICNGLFAF